MSRLPDIKAQADWLYAWVLPMLLALSMHPGYADDSPAASSSDAVAKTIDMRVKPLTCVALHKGQVCYQTLTISWPMLDDNRYCLHSNLKTTPLICWKQNTFISFSHSYASATSETFYLRREESEMSTLAEVTVSTSWVYRTNRRSSSGWRLF